MDSSNCFNSREGGGSLKHVCGVQSSMERNVKFCCKFGFVLEFFLLMNNMFYVMDSKYSFNYLAYFNVVTLSMST